MNVKIFLILVARNKRKLRETLLASTNGTGNETQ